MEGDRSIATGLQARSAGRGRATYWQRMKSMKLGDDRLAGRVEEAVDLELGEEERSGSSLEMEAVGVGWTAVLEEAMPGDSGGQQASFLVLSSGGGLAMVARCETHGRWLAEGGFCAFRRRA